MLVIGLTGNYGMGKSTVLGMFRELGAATLEADDIVDSLLREERVILKLRAVLGDDICLPDGTLDRMKVAARIFTEKEFKDKVEEILHPLVFDRIDGFLEGLERAGGSAKVVIVEIPLLFEKEYSGKFDGTVTVFTDEDVALERLGKKGVDRQSAVMRLRAQMPIEAKIKRSDFAIDNNGDVEATRRQTAEIYNKLIEIAH